MVQRSKTTILLPVLIIAIFYWIYILQTDSEAWRSTLRKPSPVDGDNPEDANTRCLIPTLNPFDPSVSSFFKFPVKPDLKCKGPPPLVAVSGLSKISISKDISTLKRYNVVGCYYRTISRVGDDNYKISGRTFFNTEANITSEFVVIECVDKKRKVVFTDYFPFITQKPDVEERVQDILHQKPKKKRLNVILLGLDSVSKNQFLRQMNKTYKFIHDNLVFAELFAYNKVGTNTFPNILAFFSGKTVEELKTNMAKTYADVLPLIWKDFANAGYRTLHAEDASSISIFNYAKKGFDQQPTDYYWRPFGLAIDASPLIKKGQRGCLNKRPETKVILKWTEDLLDTFPEDPVFALSYHTRLSHGSLGEVCYQDKPVHDFLQSLHSKGHLNNSIIIFFGDHGYRYGDFRTTYVGRMEDKLPFAFVLLPQWFPLKHPKLYKNIKINQYRLTTPFDMFATLKSILNLTNEIKVPNRGDRSISLINSVVPENRTCKDASIEPQFCACIRRRRADITDSRVYAAAQAIVNTINSLTASARNSCLPLQLSMVLDASVQEVRTGETGELNYMADFLIIVQVEPSEGMFEGTVWHSPNKDVYVADKNIERLNMYGNQSICIHDAMLKPFCYCRDNSKN